MAYANFKSVEKVEKDEKVTQKSFNNKKMKEYRVNLTIFFFCQSVSTNTQKMAHKEKRLYLMCIRLKCGIHISLCMHNFQKKCQNHCTIMYLYNFHIVSCVVKILITLA